MIIRHATIKDVAETARVEAAGFPAAEAASKESLEKRIASFPECFWIMEEDGKILSYIDGLATDSENLTDEMYEKAEMHQPNGVWQMLFSVVTDPVHFHKGYASIVMKQVIEDSKERGKKGIVLTCKEHMIGFYEQFGYKNEGISASVHGDAVWYQMRLSFDGSGRLTI